MYKQNNIQMLRGAPSECFWPNGCGDHKSCISLGSCLAKHQSDNKESLLKPMTVEKIKRVREYKPQTPAQKRASEENHALRVLAGIAGNLNCVANLHIIPARYTDAIKDNALLAISVIKKSQADRKQHREWDKEYNLSKELKAVSDEIKGKKS